MGAHRRDRIRRGTLMSTVPLCQAYCNMYRSEKVESCKRSFRQVPHVSLPLSLPLPCLRAGMLVGPAQGVPRQLPTSMRWCVEEVTMGSQMAYMLPGVSIGTRIWSDTKPLPATMGTFPSPMINTFPSRRAATAQLLCPPGTDANCFLAKGVLNAGTWSVNGRAERRTR